MFEEWAVRAFGLVNRDSPIFHLPVASSDPAHKTANFISVASIVEPSFRQLIRADGA
jgi:hypothetical protein